MRITCPYCGARDAGEFSYLGDASPRRPHFDADESGAIASDVEDAFFDYAYLRNNLAGMMDEYWYHGGGCRAWLVVTRDTRTHIIHGVRPAAGSRASPTKASSR